jgi:hypothetical protein
MKNILLALIVILATCALPLQVAYATDCPAAPKTPKQQVQAGTGAVGGQCDDSGITNILSTAVNILGIVAGIAAVIMIIVSGFRYITSGGESGKVSAAKNALIYALIGLVIVAFSQFLVHFVLSESNNATLPTCTKQQDPAGGGCVKR